MYKISEIASLFGITTKTLKYYDELGLLRPSFRNENTGYRFYSDRDISKMNDILTLKASGFELSQIINYYDDSYVPGTLLEALIKKRELLNRQIEILSDFQIVPGTYDVKQVSIPDCSCLCIEQFVTGKRGMIEIFRCLNELAVKYKTRILPLSCYTAEFPSYDRRMPRSARVCLGIEEEDITDSIPKDLLWTLPGGNYLSVIHTGPYHSLDNAYDAIKEYSEFHHMKTGNSLRKMYMRNPGNTNHAAEYVTKLLVPIL